MNRLNLPAKILAAVAILMLASGCLYRHHPAPVDTRHAALDRANVNPDALAPIHIVRSGDTLYSIAWQSRRDFRDLGRWNDIPPPYRIKPGQRIRLASVGAKKTIRQASTDTEIIPLGQSSAQTRPILQNKKSATHWNQTEKPVKLAAAPSKLEPNRPVKSWLWPSSGRHHRLVSRKKGMDGVEIFGKRGQPVKATAAGNVVYAGSGILGLGRLVIVKHNDTFLSAYAHNAEIVVKEGEQVRQGQTIAKMGNSDADKVALYFEIRKNGQPVNPLKFLARR